MSEGCPTCGALPAPAQERASAAVLAALSAHGVPTTVRRRGQKGGVRLTFAHVGEPDPALARRILDELHRAGFTTDGVHWSSAGGRVKRVGLNVRRAEVMRDA